MAGPREHKFDWDEAAILYGRGMLKKEIARRLGVSVSAVTFAIDPVARARSHAYSTEWQRRNKIPCANGCGRTVWGTSIYRTSNPICQTCYHATMPRAPHGTVGRAKRCHCEECRAASREAKREWRRRNMLVCEVCGGPVPPDGHTQRAQIICKDCYLDSVSKPVRWVPPWERQARA